ncbi:MAG: hypothetical protein LBV76_04805 [Deltaproteobacteria bacterium]|jgi:hypothetical protein|nr:hypothetical protein [Deltaproteobacteria bacterium]
MMCLSKFETETQNMDRICARILLYTRGLSLDPLLCLELSLECLRRTRVSHTGDDTANDPAQDFTAAPDFAAAMDELHRMLREKGLKATLSDHGGMLLRSSPPLNRRHMLPEDLDSSVLLLLKKKLGLS